MASSIPRFDSGGLFFFKGLLKNERDDMQLRIGKASRSWSASELFHATDSVKVRPRGCLGVGAQV